MNVPNFQDIQFTNKDGSLHPIWKGILTQLFTELQINNSNSGTVIPSKTDTEVGVILPTRPNFSMLGETNTGNLRILINGTVKTIPTT